MLSHTSFWHPFDLLFSGSKVRGGQNAGAMQRQCSQNAALEVFEVLAVKKVSWKPVFQVYLNALGYGIGICIFCVPGSLSTIMYGKLETCKLHTSTRVEIMITGSQPDSLAGGTQSRNLSTGTCTPYNVLRVQYYLYVMPHRRFI
jgi:hypothetical protein